MQVTKRFASKAEDLAPAYWDTILHACRGGKPLDCWRAYMRRVYLGLLDAWVPETKEGGGLKTDLFEEALSDFSLLPHMGPNATGVDCSTGVVQAAQQRLNGNAKGQRLIVCDLRKLPIGSGSIRYVLSGSSLDHFKSESDFCASLGEMNRVLAPGGTAVITLDNPHNPVVWMRNHLPISWLMRLGVVPYYVGHTPRRQEACRQLEQAGFEVLEVSSVAHAPRLPAVWLIATLERLGWRSSNRTISRWLQACEKMQTWPMRFQTGYYVAYRVRKRAGGLRSSEVETSEAYDLSVRPKGLTLEIASTETRVRRPDLPRHSLLLQDDAGLKPACAGRPGAARLAKRSARAIG